MIDRNRPKSIKERGDINLVCCETPWSCLRLFIYTSRPLASASRHKLCAQGWLTSGALLCCSHSHRRFRFFTRPRTKLSLIYFLIIKGNVHMSRAGRARVSACVALWTIWVHLDVCVLVSASPPSPLLPVVTCGGWRTASATWGGCVCAGAAVSQAPLLLDNSVGGILKRFLSCGNEVLINLQHVLQRACVSGSFMRKESLTSGS